MSPPPVAETVKVVLAQVVAFDGCELTSGGTFTVTVIAVAEPAHEFAVEVGVTLYTILPAVVVLGFVKA